jgi:hypothetical protein
MFNVRAAINVIGNGNAATQSYADDAAQDAEDSAKSFATSEAESFAQDASDSLKQEVESKIGESLSGNTLISGGYIRTNLLNVDYIFGQEATLTGHVLVGDIEESYVLIDPDGELDLSSTMDPSYDVNLSQLQFTVNASQSDEQNTTAWSNFDDQKPIFLSYEISFSSNPML